MIQFVSLEYVYSPMPGGQKEKRVFFELGAPVLFGPGVPRKGPSNQSSFAEDLQTCSGNGAQTPTGSTWNPQAVTEEP